MKHLSLRVLSLSAVALSLALSSAFAADATLPDSVVYRAETASGFMVTEILVIDDRNLLVTFSQELAQEPVNVELLAEKGTQTPVLGVEVQEKRMSAKVKLGAPLVASEKYSLFVTSALSMLGGKLAQKPALSKTSDQGIAFNAPAKLVLSPESASGAAAPTQEDLAAANDKAVDQAAKDSFANPPAPAQPTSTDTPETTATTPSATDTSADMTKSASTPEVAASGASMPAQAQTLPETGPQMWILLLFTILLSGAWLTVRTQKS